MTACPSGQGDGLEIHWALPAGARIPSLSSCSVKAAKASVSFWEPGFAFNPPGRTTTGASFWHCLCCKRGPLFAATKIYPKQMPSNSQHRAQMSNLTIRLLLANALVLCCMILFPGQCVRVAKEMDSTSIGLCPQGLESPRCRISHLSEASLCSYLSGVCLRRHRCLAERSA